MLSAITKKNRKIIFFSLILTLLCTASAYAEKITVSREEGHFVELIDYKQFDDIEYIAVDDIVRIFQLVKYWHPLNQKVILHYEKIDIEMFIDNPRIIIDKKFVEISSPPKIIDGKIMLPLSFVYKNIAEIVDKIIIWDADKKTITINKSGYNVTRVRVHTYPSVTRIAIDITKEMEYKIEKQLSTRIAVSIKDGVVDTVKCRQEVNNNNVKEVVSFQNKDTAMIYIDLKDKDANFKHFLLTNPYRIVIDVKGTIKNQIAKSDQVVKDDNRTEKIKKPDISDKTVEAIKHDLENADKNKHTEEKEISKKKKITTIVIDPGHGGKDPGAIGPSGLKEKDVVLKVGLELKELLVKYLGVRVILTRTGDYFVPLGERTRTANFNQADVFISIHTNASFSSRSSGFEVFHFAAGMNLDPYALAVVMKENSVMKLEGKKFSKMSDIDIIVYDVLQTEYVKESREFALITKNAFDMQKEIKNRGVKRGPFFVLRNARMPSILVETGFISNRTDEKNMRSRTYINTIAKSLYDSIVEYKKKVEKE